jgi:hypothetical protein
MLSMRPIEMLITLSWHRKWAGLVWDIKRGLGQSSVLCLAYHYCNLAPELQIFPTHRQGLTHFTCASHTKVQLIN